MKKLFLHPLSLEEIIHAKTFYDSKVDGLGSQLVVEINRAIELIDKMPETWPVYNNKLRRYILKRFPFSIIYRLKNNTIQIIAFMHQHRKPYYWKKRLN